MVFISCLIHACMTYIALEPLVVDLCSPLLSSPRHPPLVLMQANCEVHPVLRETFCCKDGHGVGPNKNDVPELLT